MDEDSLSCELLVVGAGAAGLTAAAVASSLGMSTVIAEQHETVGGTTSLSGGTIWIPSNPIAARYGIQDSKGLGKEYMQSALDATDKRESSAPAIINAFLESGPLMVAYLQAAGFRWNTKPSKFPDYHPNLPGALVHGGRTLNPATFDAELLGPWKKYLNMPKGSPQAAKFEDFRTITSPLASAWDLLTFCWITACAVFRNLFSGCAVTMGCSLVAQLLYICQRGGIVQLRTSTSLLELTTENDRVVGAVLVCGDRRIRVRSRCGVLLAAAGFSRNERLRHQYLPKPTSATWSLSRADADSGHALEAAMSIGAKTDLLQETWGIPTMKDPCTGQITSALFELAKPHSIVIDNSGTRFANESQPYGDFVRSMYAVEGATPAWLIIDRQYLLKYTLGSLKPWEPIEPAVRSGLLVEANSLEALSQKLLLPKGRLVRTVERWNLMCQDGRDVDFARGCDAYQQFIGDTRAKPNPAMGPINTAPFYAVRIYPGDAGTKGGLATDRCGRVQSRSGGAIDGLYAAGNVAASLFGQTSLGAGVTIGPAMTFAFVAVHCMFKSATGTHSPSS
ncbi:hypothetical protein Purlil1_12755 [Purpureocillium lilacinum]|uniref:FAD-dependent oxidoreductase 2 FAD-binding domain-containing protein n=1 Tax=Purpureocillium lilacinum TaxID=33203 RepID=A0ABR0BFY9_PURLI|nr:hypothetical protein Purlil1_12755 [Purpureocillium lilacinum]